ncbi:DUF6850 family outer membrane beta-barrel protein [Abyssalbus ytuae]|uniref:DUF6850 domain-containing protein n=1 Tax=Abyssalbus ytuae TaxID=2926907 RepID=A0A9E7CXY4_9FLAO|nr:DUF6850 family outer membrane beta-barrel protein [Abyssalbus ytuae]UOB16060.1 hypothetical protein MQE35_09945 [Abyssalbus ytuae]
MYKKNCFYFFIFLLFIGFNCRSQSNIEDSSLNNLNGLRLLYADYIWLTSDNPVGIAEINQPRLGKAFLGFAQEQGSFFNYNSPKSIDNISFLTEGYTKPNKISYYGKLKYQKSKEYNLVWNDASFIAEENPFIIADSIGGNYDNEIFYLEGKMSSKNAAGNLIWGLALSYKVGNKVDQTDPRPEISSVLFSFKPGVSIVCGQWVLGTNLYLTYLKEKVDFDVVDTHTNYRYFRFMGFGKYLGLSGDDLTRFYKGWDYGGSLQAQYIASHWTNLLEVQLHQDYQRAEEGSGNTRFLAGDYTKISFEVSDRIRFVREWGIHEISLKGGISEIEGKWFDQHQVTDNEGTQYWEVYNESIRYKKTILQAGAGYALMSKLRDTRISQILSAGLNLRMDMADFYPEGYSQNIYNLTARLGVFKQWQTGQTDFSIDIELDYRYNPQSDLDIDEIELVEQVSYPDHYFRSSDYLNVNGILKLGIPKLFNKSTLPYIAIENRWLQTTGTTPYFEKSAYRLYSGVRLGLIF